MPQEIVTLIHHPFEIAQSDLNGLLAQISQFSKASNSSCEYMDGDGSFEIRGPTAEHVDIVSQKLISSIRALNPPISTKRTYFDTQKPEQSENAPSNSDSEAVVLIESEIPDDMPRETEAHYKISDRIPSAKKLLNVAYDIYSTLWKELERQTLTRIEYDGRIITLNGMAKDVQKVTARLKVLEKLYLREDFEARKIICFHYPSVRVPFQLTFAPVNEVFSPAVRCISKEYLAHPVFRTLAVFSDHLDHRIFSNGESLGNHLTVLRNRIQRDDFDQVQSDLIQLPAIEKLVLKHGFDLPASNGERSKSGQSEVIDWNQADATQDEALNHSDFSASPYPGQEETSYQPISFTSDQPQTAKREFRHIRLQKHANPHDDVEKPPGVILRDYNFSNIKDSLTEGLNHLQYHCGEVYLSAYLGICLYTQLKPATASKLWHYSDFNDSLRSPEAGLKALFSNGYSNSPNFIARIGEVLGKGEKRVAHFEVAVEFRINPQVDSWQPALLFINTRNVSYIKILLGQVDDVDILWNSLDRNFDFRVKLGHAQLLRTDRRPFSTFLNRFSVSLTKQHLSFEEVPDNLRVKSVLLKTTELYCLKDPYSVSITKVQDIPLIKKQIGQQCIVNGYIDKAACYYTFEVNNSRWNQALAQNSTLGIGEVPEWTTEDILGGEGRHLIDFIKSLIRLCEASEKEVLKTDEFD